MNNWSRAILHRLSFAPSFAQNKTNDNELPNSNLTPDTPKPAKKFTKRDFIIMSHLWTFEIVFAAMEAMRNAMTRASFGGGVLSKDMIAHHTSSCSFVVCVSLIVLAVSNAFCGSAKVVPLVVGISVYHLTSVFGILMVTPTSHILPLIMISLQVGWYASTPMRYWLIFHQRIPLRANSSLLFVGWNSFLVSIAIYFTTVYIENSRFINVEYLLAWVVLGLVMLVWISGVILSKNRFNNTPDDCSVISAEYESTEVSKHFQARQRNSHLILFLLVLFPSCIFPMTREMVSSSLRGLPENMNTDFRLDLIVYVACVPVITFLLYVFACVRHEVRGLLFLGAAHVANLIMVVLFVIMISKSSTDPATIPTTTAGPSTDHTTTDNTWTPSLWANGQALLLISQIDRGHHCYNRFYAKCSPLSDEPRVLKTLNETKRFFVEGFNESTARPVIFSGYVDVEPLKSRLYIVTRENGLLHVPGPEHMFKSVLSRKKYHIVSLLPPCNDGPEVDDNGRRGLSVDKTCHSVKYSMVEFGANDQILKEGFEIGPKYATVSDLIFPQNDTERITISIFVDGEKTAHPPGELDFRQSESDKLKKKHPMDWWGIVNFDLPKSTGLKPKTLFVKRSQEEFASKGLCWNDDAWFTPTPSMATPPGPPIPNFYEFMGALALSGVVTAVVSVSYIHFIWIQCPCESALLIIGYFVVVNFVGGWAFRHFVVALDSITVWVVFSLQSLFLIWHCVATGFFWRNLLELSAGEWKTKNNMRF
ncbi:Hypothetical protein NTJ_12244 [Nesidiocoris tenuis]|uniref:Uncharacterized protein n=1 Tax=Nesidiocoris tenuis TaxID=355587 RepID=A0ABN7B9E6_9HEMI|nr:Hypothetical protein NTJ_12244 [Nesidiocoris tenuis]